MKNSLSIDELIRNGADCIKAAGIENSRLDASVLLANVLGLERERLLSESKNIAEPAEIAVFNSLLERRCKNEPIAYIIGKKEFWSLDFAVTPATLIPRPDSETLVEAALKRAKNIAHEQVRPLNSLNIDILDIGTGTACLLIALLKEL